MERKEDKGKRHCRSPGQVPSDGASAASDKAGEEWRRLWRERKRRGKQSALFLAVVWGGEIVSPLASPPRNASVVITDPKKFKKGTLLGKSVQNRGR